MADCDLCGVSRPTLCPVKVLDPEALAAYPSGTWRGLNEECLEKCDLCGAKNMPLFEVKVEEPVFQQPYHKELDRALCESCLNACDDAVKRREAEKKELHH